MKRRLVNAAVLGASAAVICQGGFYVCLFAGGALAGLPYTVFSFLAFWPLALLTLMNTSDRIRWPMLNILSMIGWVVLAILAALMFHIFTNWCRRRFDKKPSE